MEIAALKTPRIAKRRALMGRAIAARRTHLGISVQRAADAVGVYRTTWYRWENGTSSIPAELVPDVASQIELDVADLMNVAA